MESLRTAIATAKSYEPNDNLAIVPLRMDEAERVLANLEHADFITTDASEIIGYMAGVIFGLYLMGETGNHNGKPYRDIAGELKAATNAAEVRGALGMPPNVGHERAAKA